MTHGDVFNAGVRQESALEVYAPVNAMQGPSLRGPPSGDEKIQEHSRAHDPDAVELLQIKQI